MIIFKIICFQIIFFIAMYFITLFYFTVMYSQEKDYYEKKDFNKFKDYIDKKVNHYFKSDELFSTLSLFFLFTPILGFIYTFILFTSLIILDINRKFLISKKIYYFNKNITKNLINFYNKFLEKFHNFFVKEYNELRELEKK